MTQVEVTYQRKSATQMVISYDGAYGIYSDAIIGAFKDLVATMSEEELGDGGQLFVEFPTPQKEHTITYRRSSS